MRLPILSLVSALAFVALADRSANSEGFPAASSTSVVLSAAPCVDAELVDIAGPSLAAFSVVYFDSAGVGQLVATGALGADGSAAVFTPQIEGGSASVSFVEVRILVGNDEVITTRLVEMDPLFLWQ